MWNFLFLNFDLVTGSEFFFFFFFFFQLGINISWVKKWKFNLQVSNWKSGFMFSEVKLVTPKKNSCQNVRTSNSKCDVF